MGIGGVINREERRESMILNTRIFSLYKTNILSAIQPDIIAIAT